jgi:predicted PurR-regulated permease PerM
MRATSEIVAPILLALVIAVCISPILRWLTKKGAPTWLAFLLTIGITALSIVALVWLVSASVQEFSESISAYEERFEEIEQSLGGAVDNLGIDVQTLAADKLAAPRELLKLAAEFAGGVVSGLSNWVLIALLVIFFLVEATSMPRKVHSVSQEDDPDVQQIFALNRGLREYMVINAGVGLLAAVVKTILLALLGVEFAVLWGVLAFFMSFIPSIGAIIAVIPPAIMALIQFGWQQMLVVIAAYIIINFLAESIIKPRFIEEDVNISVPVTFVSLVVWAWVLGPIGAILAVPLAITIQTIFAAREETRWLAYMMGSGKEPFKSEAEPDLDVEGGGLAPEGGG